MAFAGRVFLGFFLLVWVASQAPDMGSANSGDEGHNKPLLSLDPINLGEVDFPVPWGFRYGQPARVFFTFEVGPDGRPANIETLKTIPHNDYEGIAKTTLKKFRYKKDDIGKRGFEELHYCVLTDGQSTFACKITFERVSGQPEKVAHTPSDPGFYEIDKYGGFPRVRRHTLPEYPQQAARTKTCGWVRARFEVNPSGVPRNIEIIETSNGGTFSLVSREVLQIFRFQRGEEKTVLQYLIRFEIPGKC